MEGLVSESNLNIVKDNLRIVVTEWIHEGFDIEDIKEYFSEFIDTI